MGSRGPTASSASTINFAPGVPPAPNYLSEGAKEEYTRIAKLHPNLQQVDIGVLSTYARAYDDCAQLSQMIIKDGHVVVGARGGVILNPAIRALESAEGRLLAAASRLGLSPQDRQRIQSKATVKINPFMAMMDESKGSRED